MEDLEQKYVVIGKWVELDGTENWDNLSYLDGNLLTFKEAEKIKEKAKNTFQDNAPKTHDWKNQEIIITIEKYQEMLKNNELL